MRKDIAKVRGHHLHWIEKEVSRQELAEQLVEYGYVQSEDHPFVSYAFDFFRDLRGNPDVQIDVVSGQEDAICGECPLCGGCEIVHVEKSLLYGSLFFDESGGDKGALEEIGLGEGRYTVREILDAVSS